MKKTLSMAALLIVFFLPVLTPSVAHGLVYGDPGFVGPPSAADYAASQSSGNSNIPLTSLDSALKGIGNLMKVLVPLIIGLAVIAFLYGVMKYVLNGGSEDARSEGRAFMIWGIIGIVVMVSVWGLVVFVQNSFGLTKTSPVGMPQIPSN